MSEFEKTELGKLADQCHQFNMIAEDCASAGAEEVCLPVNVVTALCHNFVFMYRKLYGDKNDIN